jgi:GH15 family glucan-1,4-alpha-glucosidase
VNENLEKGKYRDFYYRQLDFIAKKDVEGLIHTQYTEDAELLNFDYHIVGTAALIEYFKNYIASLGYIKLLSTDKYAETDDSLFFESTVEVAGGVAEVYDVFVMRNGKIWRHFAGLRSFTPKA